jgi:hypothetical protein
MVTWCRLRVRVPLTWGERMTFSPALIPNPMKISRAGAFCTTRSNRLWTCAGAWGTRALTGGKSACCTSAGGGAACSALGSMALAGLLGTVWQPVSRLAPIIINSSLRIVISLPLQGWIHQ